MKDSKFRYYLCYYSHLCFFYSFWGYFFILIILHLLGMEMNAYLGYLFFLLLDYGEEVLLHYLQLVI